MRGLYWEQWDIGAEFESPARTITEADITLFAGLSGDYNPLHVSDEYGKNTIFGGRSLPFSIPTRHAAVHWFELPQNARMTRIRAGKPSRSFVE